VKHLLLCASSSLVGGSLVALLLGCMSSSSPLAVRGLVDPSLGHASFSLDGGGGAVRPPRLLLLLGRR
jgi:hypothetical protein